MKKQATKFRVELSGRELNYIECALMGRIGELREDAARNIGNTRILWLYSRRVLSRLRKVREAGPARGRKR